jgi:hypothetical protein
LVNIVLAVFRSAGLYTPSHPRSSIQCRGGYHTNC